MAILSIKRIEGGKLHNLVRSFIGFNEIGSLDPFYDFFNRSNIDVYTIAASLGEFYDDTNRATRSRFHISELTNEATLRSYFQIDEDYKMFLKILPSHDDQEYIDEMVVYKMNKEGAELDKVKSWAKM